MIDAPPDGSNDEFNATNKLKGSIMGFLEHLEELRIRLIRSFLILTGGTLVCLFFSEQLIDFLTRTFSPDHGGNLALLYPTEGFVVRLKIAFVAGLFLTAPLWFIQIWGFVSPGLYKREKKVVIPVILGSSVTFMLGAVFGYVILPYAIQYFQSLSTTGVEVSWSVGRYIDFSLRLLVAFGVVFELPLAIYAAAQLGVVTPVSLRKYRRHAIIAVLVASALITPPDLFTQIVLAVPLVILYEAGILMAVLAGKKRGNKGDSS